VSKPISIVHRTDHFVQRRRNNTTISIRSAIEDLKNSFAANLSTLQSRSITNGTVTFGQ
jgi:hypothetical protein